MRKLNEETGVYDLEGANDVGVGTPTGVAGDFGVDVDANAAWWEVTSLGTYAVGLPAAQVILPPEPGPEPDLPQLTTAPECGMGGGICGAFGMICLPVTLLTMLNMRRRLRQRNL